MKKTNTAIITNHSLRYFAGSELVTLDMAKVLSEMGWRVYVACFESNQTMRELFDAFVVGWIDLSQSTLDLDEEVGLLWGHHFTTFDRLLVDYGLRPQRVIYSSLSPFEPLEAPPLYFQCLSGISANSHETRERLLQLGVESEKIVLFENCVPDHYFEMSRSRQYDTLRRVAVISNHVPAEVAGAMRLLGGQAHVDIFGLSHKSVLVTPELLQTYDLIVTIGRTVQQCFALEVPIYCYDRFGGPGYLDASSFEQAAAYNFSGRCCERVISAQALFIDMLQGYQAALANLTYLKSATQARFRLSSVTSELLIFVAPHEYGGIPEALQRLLLQHLRYYERTPVAKPVEHPPAPVASPGSFAAVRAIAFHLPQYHQVAENDRWWGEGFTEWTNVRQGTPTFDGHYQPHVPGEMGYYDLSDISVLERQAALAREHGLEGFCFYYYWFDGKRLLEKPVDMLLEHPEIDLPFCLCWANENWTRRWDGGDQEVLIAQTYDPALDERFARDMTPYLSDPRYIRVAGKPVVLVYRGDLIPDLPGTLAAWRQAWRQAGIGEVYLVGVESFRVYDPDVVGFDANCEFLPHQVDRVQVAPDEPLISPQLPLQFLGDYNKLADHWSERSRPPYKRFRSLVPSWDNSARRRKGGAGLFINATPARYQSWLERTLERTCEEFEGDERLVFINAWNEWGEGCHLEPDERFGRGYLEATRDAQQALQKRLPIQAQPSNAFQQDYQQWCASRVLAPGERARVAERIESWGALPRILIVIDVSDASAEVLQSTLDSLERQTYGAEQVWLRSEPLSVQCDASLEWLPEAQDWAVLDGHLERAKCDWLLLLRAGDVLDEQTLLLLADHSANHTGLACCYFDEDRVLDGEYTEPFFKPDFNLDLLRSYPYCGRVLAFERKALLEVGGFIGNFATLSPLDLLWRLFERKGFGSVGHIAHVLIHSSYGLGRWLAEGAVQEQVALVTSAHLSRLGIAHQVSPGSVAPLARVHYGAAAQPRVSIIVHAQDQLPLLQRCVESILEKTSYRHYELMLIDNASQQAESLDWFAGMQAMAGSSLQVIRLDQAHNRAALFNLAAARAQGEYLLLLSADTAVIEPGWLEAMLNHAQRPEVGIVGARLIGADQRILHAGLILGLYGVVGSPFEGADASQPGYMHRALVEQNYSAVSADCMLVRRDVLLALQGFDESEQAQSFADVDFCLRARGDGYLTVWTPYATLLQGSSGSRAVQQAMSDASIDLFYERWLGIAAADPAYSRSLSLQADFRLEPVAEQLPWQPFAARAVPSFLCLAADRFGSGQYRVIQPFNALRDYGFAQGAISSYLHTPLHIERMAPDAIILQRLYGAFEPQLRRLKAFSSAFKVFELDDYILELPELSEHRGAFGKHVERELSQAVALCDRLVVSTEELGHALRHLHPDIRVAQNRLEPTLWNVQPVPSPRRRPGRPRVGWAGGAGHTGDLLLLADVIKALASEVDWVFFGMCPAQLMPYVAEYHAGVSFERYPQRLASLDLDIALAPLERNRFNICKSNLRLLEYGACAYPVICSDIEPYLGVLPVTRVSNHSKAWVEAIRAHLADPQASRRAGLDLQAHVLADWMLTEEAALEWGRAWLPD